MKTPNSSPAALAAADADVDVTGKRAAQAKKALKLAKSRSKSAKQALKEARKASRKADKLARKAQQRLNKLRRKIPKTGKGAAISQSPVKAKPDTRRRQKPPAPPSPAAT